MIKNIQQLFHQFENAFSGFLLYLNYPWRNINIIQVWVDSIPGNAGPYIIDKASRRVNRK